MIVRVEQVIIKEPPIYRGGDILHSRHLRQIYVGVILNETLKMRKVSSRWIPQVHEHKASRIAIYPAILRRDDGMNDAFNYRSELGMNSVSQSWNQTTIDSVEVHWFTTIDEMSG